MRKLVVMVLLMCAATTAHAQWREALDSSTLYWENDNFGRGRKSDRFYTNGVRYSAAFRDHLVEWKWPKTLRDRVWRLDGIKGSQPLESVGFVLGQNFYTPQIITIAAPQPLDRPWAGVLYGGLSETITDAQQRLSHTFELRIGILGPGAGAQATQKYVHNTLGFSNNDPQGWDNQLRNEPTLSVFYQHMQRMDVKKGVLDFVPSYGALLGSPQTNVDIGGTLRLGYHVSGLPAPLISGAANAGRMTPHFFEAYVFAGAEGRYVPFNATLDGGLFRSGPKANGVKRLIADTRLGASVRVGWARLSYSTVTRSAEFNPPPGALRTQRFGSYAFTIEPFNDFR